MALIPHYSSWAKDKSNIRKFSGSAIFVFFSETKCTYIWWLKLWHILFSWWRMNGHKGKMKHSEINSTNYIRRTSSVQFRSVASDSLWPHGLQHTRPPCLSPTPWYTQTYVHWVSDAIQASHPLPSPSPAAINLSQHQCLFQWISSLSQVAKVLEFQL